MVSLTRIMAVLPTHTLSLHYPAKLWLLALFIAASLGNAISQDSSNPIYYSSVSEVRLVFFASDAQGHLLQDISKDDFAVVDNEEVIRNFRSFVRPAETRLDVVVLFDSSASVLPNFQQELSNILQLVSQLPWNTEDQLSVLSFSGTQTYTLCIADCASALTADRILATPRGGSTPLFDALHTATNLLQSREQAGVWRVIVLLSDGDDTISIASIDQALHEILSSGTYIYAMNLSRFSSSRGTRTLRTLAGTSGGRYLENADNATEIVATILDDFHSAGVVTYALPPSSSDFHAVRILPTHNLNSQFRSVHGYYTHASNTHSEAHP